MTRLANDHHAAVSRALKALDAHLQSAPIHTVTADLIFAAASAVLLGRGSTDHVGWICHWHGDPCAVHLTAPQMAWEANLPHNAGRLLHTIDLGWWWRKAAGDPTLLAEAADRHTQVTQRETAARAQLKLRAHQRGAS